MSRAQILTIVGSSCVTAAVCFVVGTLVGAR